MRIIRDYILKEAASPFLLSLAVLTLIMLLGNLIRLAELVITKGVKLLLVGKLFLYLMPTLLSFTIPIASLCAVMLSFGRMSSDNEIIAFRTNGINLFKIIMPLIVAGSLISLGSVILNDKIIPASQYASRKAYIEIGLKNPTAALEAGTFINSFDKYILFVYKIEGNMLYNVRIYEPQENKPTRTIVAKRGEFISFPKEYKIKLKLMDGTSDEPNPENPNNFYKLNFKTYFMTLNILRERDPNKIEKKPKEMTIKEIYDSLNRMKINAVDIPEFLIALHKKLTFSFSPIVFILLGSALGIKTHRKQFSINLFLAVMVVAIYYLLSIGAEAISSQGNVPVSFVMWVPNLLFSILAIILTVKLCV